MGESFNLYLTVALVAMVAVAGIVILVRLISSPIKKILKLLFNTALGFGILFVINLVGQNFGYSFEINLTRCVVAAIFGVPGVTIMVILTILL